MSDPLAYGLPHCAPFLFIDAVTAATPGESAVCTKTFAPDEPFFRGHFPGQPIVPGVILTEALAQTAGIAAGHPQAGASYRLTAIRQMKFLRAVLPGEPLELRATLSASAVGLRQVAVTASVAGVPVAEGVIVLSEA